MNICTVFIMQCYFKVPKDVTLNCKYFLLGNLQANKNFNKSHLIIHQILS